MVSSFLILLREGAEASIIVAIVLAYLHRKTGGQGRKFVWLGVGLAVLASIIMAVICHFTLGGFSGRVEEIFEGFLMLAACGVLIYMVVWTARAAKDLKSALTARVDTSLANRQLGSLVMLVFFAVWREGAETVLFLTAIKSDSFLASLAGSALGLAAAIGLGFTYYRASEKLNLRRFFQATAVLLILMAAGLGAHGVHELQEAKIVPVVKKNVFDINPLIRYTPGPAVEYSKPQLMQTYPDIAAKMIGDEFLSRKYKPYIKYVEAGAIKVSNPVALAIHERGAVGGLAKAVFGYNGNPTLLELTAYVFLLVSSSGLFWMVSRRKN